MPFADPDADDDSEEGPPDLNGESEPETVDYRDDDDDEDESDRGSGGAPSRTRISEWFTEFPDFVDHIREGLERSEPDQHGSARRSQVSQDSEEDLAAALKRDVLSYFELHCKDQGIICDLDEIDVDAPNAQDQFAYFGSTPIGPATCPCTGAWITAPSARDGADGDPSDFVELEMSPQASQV